MGMSMLKVWAASLASDYPRVAVSQGLIVLRAWGARGCDLRNESLAKSTC